MITQSDVLQAYAELVRLRPEWSHRFVLIPTLGQASAPSAMAAVICGASALAISVDMETARNAMKLNCCDYVVDSLDEAVRILKNSVRTGKAVAVALVGVPADIVQEMDSRGIVPDHVVHPPSGRVLVKISAAATPAERRSMDAEIFAAADPHTRRWLDAARVFFPRDLDRALPATPLLP